MTQEFATELFQAGYERGYAFAKETANADRLLSEKFYMCDLCSKQAFLTDEQAENYGWNKFNGATFCRSCNEAI